MGEDEDEKLLSPFPCGFERGTAKGLFIPLPYVYLLMGQPALEPEIVIGWIFHAQYILALGKS